MNATGMVRPALRGDGSGVDARSTTDRDEMARPTSWRRPTAIEMIISASIGMYASFVLSIDAVLLAADPDAQLGCNVNKVLNCGAVAREWQAHLLGFPNAFLGIAAEAVVLTVAVAILGGVVFPRWFMIAAQCVYTVGLLFAYWLFFVSFVQIGALCPWCLLITATTTLVWAGLTRINIGDGNLRLPRRAGPWARRFVAAGNDWFVTASILVALCAAIMAKYGTALVA